MTQEIIEMARQAGLVFDAKKPELSVYPPALETFAKLVAAKERERIKEEQQRCYVDRGKA
jgi:hypothetical protein